MNKWFQWCCYLTLSVDEVVQLHCIVLCDFLEAIYQVVVFSQDFCMQFIESNFESLHLIFYYLFKCAYFYFLKLRQSRIPLHIKTFICSIICRISYYSSEYSLEMLDAWVVITCESTLTLKTKLHTWHCSEHLSSTKGIRALIPYTLSWTIWIRSVQPVGHNQVIQSIPSHPQCLRLYRQKSNG